MFVEGYTDQLSYRAGEQVRFHVATSADEYALEVTRIGAEREVVWRQDNCRGRPIQCQKTLRPMAAAGRFPASWRYQTTGAVGITSSRCASKIKAASSCGEGGARPRAGASSSSARWPHGRPHPPPASYQHLQQPTTTGRLQLLTAITAAAACRGIASPSTVRWPGCSIAGSATLSSGRRALDTRSTTAPIPTSNGIPICWTTIGSC